LIQRLNISAPAERQETYSSGLAHTSRDSTGFLIRQIISATLTIIRACEKEFSGIDSGEIGIVHNRAFERNIPGLSHAAAAKAQDGQMFSRCTPESEINIAIDDRP
jgi:hypothetical protein